jgi:signal transduction histidine kinase
VACDRIQIQQVVMNLLGNAIDAMIGPDHGETLVNGKNGRKNEGRNGGTRDRNNLVIVHAMSAHSPRSVIFAIRDNGPGIPPDLAPRVFEPLMTARPDGLGLGLPICTLIVEAHGGRIWLESTAPTGSEFRFSLPAAPQEVTHGG